MFHVPSDAPRGNPWRLALLWMGVAVINMVVSSLIYPLLFSLFDVSGSNFRLISRTVDISSHMLVITLQWLVLRRFFAGMRWWAPAHVTILVLLDLLEPFIRRLAAKLVLTGGSGGSSTSGIMATDATAILIWALVTGMVGWWLFRRFTRRAWLWPAALLLGALAQALVMIVMLGPLLESGMGGGRANLYGLINLALSLLLAMIQAAALMLFVRDQQRLAAAQSTQLGYQ